MEHIQPVSRGGATTAENLALSCQTCNIGTDRMDMCLRYGEVTLAMEWKVWREGRVDPLKAGLAQLDRYLAGLGLEAGWLVIFDQRSGLVPIGERTTTERVRTVGDRDIVVIRG